MRTDRIEAILGQLKTIRDHPEVQPGSFNMSEWVVIEDHDNDWPYEIYELDNERLDIIKSADKCGTSACIAGWAVLLWPDLIDLDAEDEGWHTCSVSQQAADILDLSRHERDYMFLGDWCRDEDDGSQLPVEEVTLESAIEYLDAVLETGDVYQQVTQ